ncbi:MAG: HD-GYP domain-containing protein [bacterium]
MSRKHNLANRLDQELDLPDEHDSFLDVMNLTGEQLFEALSDQRLPDDDADAVQSFLQDRQDMILDFWDDLRDLMPQLLDSIDEPTRSEVFEEFQSITDDIIQNHLKKPIEDSLYQSESTAGATEQKRGEQLQKALDERNYTEIKRLNSLPETVIDAYQSHYRRPDELNKWQRKLLDNHESILNQLILGLRVPRENVHRYLRQFREVYERESKPFSLFAQPPDPEHYHLIHSYNTALLSLMVGVHLELPGKALESLLLASALADVGMTVIPDSFYLMPDEMSRRAQNEVRKHPIYSRKITSHIFGPQHSVTRTVAEHHERLDGEGYPEGKTEEGLSPLSSIVGFTDRYTAMIEERTYRSAKMPDQVLTILNQKNGRSKRKAIEAIEAIIGLYPNGSLVKLSNGTLAFVAAQSDNPPEPVVYVLTDEKRNRLDSPVKKDLTEEELSVEVLLRTRSS